MHSGRRGVTLVALTIACVVSACAQDFRQDGSQRGKVPAPVTVSLDQPGVPDEAGLLSVRIGVHAAVAARDLVLVLEPRKGLRIDDAARRHEIGDLDAGEQVHIAVDVTVMQAVGMVVARIQAKDVEGRILRGATVLHCGDPEAVKAHLEMPQLEGLRAPQDAESQPAEDAGL